MNGLKWRHRVFIHFRILYFLQVNKYAQLHSADVWHLLLPRTSTIMLVRSCSLNSLPTELRHPDLTLGTFKWQMKTVLFRRCRTLALVTARTYVTYSLTVPVEMSVYYYYYY